MRKCQLNYGIINIFSVQNKLCGGEEKNLSQESNHLEIKDLNNNANNNNTSKNELINPINTEKYDNEIQTDTYKQEETIETNRQNIININNDDNKKEKKEENNINNDINNNLNINNINSKSKSFEGMLKKKIQKKK